MPTPSEKVTSDECRVAREKKPRSVFSNYADNEKFVASGILPDVEGGFQPPGIAPESPENDLDFSRCCSAGLEATALRQPGMAAATDSKFVSLQSEIDGAMARSFLYRLLAAAFEYPSEQNWQWLCRAETKNSFVEALKNLSSSEASELLVSGKNLSGRFVEAEFENFKGDYIGVFGHAARGACPLNEIEYGELKADPLFQPHRLADLGAFYRAFGLNVSAGACERHDHISLELEFMCVLAAKEAYALENQLEEEPLSLCRDAQKKFLREHVGRWTPAFARRAARSIGVKATLGLLADFTRVFVEIDCRHFGVEPGNEDLLLRPIDEAAESMCGSCGINQLPPGASAS